MPTIESDPAPWHLDKRIHVALIFALAMQSAGAVWWASNQSARLEQTELRVARLETGAARSQEASNKLANMLAGIVQSQQDVRRSLDWIVRRIDAQQPLQKQ